MQQSDHIAAHGHSSAHRREEASDRCGCFYCLAIFPPSRIDEWVDDEDGTAPCPECGIDSVIGSAAGFPITNEFLDRMRRHWFA
jgi:hypothetical protein